MGKAKVNDEPARRRPQHSDEKLLSAATVVFARDGFAAATVAAVAAQCGATKPTLYARYGSKAELYRAAVLRERDVFLGELFGAYVAAQAEPVPVLIERAVHAWFDFADRRPEAFRLLFSVADSSPAGALIAEMHEAVTARVTGLIEGVLSRLGQDEHVTAAFVAAMIVGACVDGAYRVQSEPSLTAARAARVATAFVQGGVWGLNRPLLEV